MSIQKLFVFPMLISGLGLILAGRVAGQTPTTLVTNIADSGPGSLRQVIADASPGDSIGFLVTGTITLSAQLLIDKSLTIAGPGATNLVISGHGATRLFNVIAGPTAISGLRLDHGWDLSGSSFGGAAILNSAYLTLDSCELNDNESIFRGGAVMSSGASAALIATACTFAENSSVYYLDGGGAIWSDSLLRITNCTFSANYSANDGGAVDSSGDAVIASSTFARNRAEFGSGGAILNDGGTLTLQDSIVSGSFTFFYNMQDVGGNITSGDYNLIQYTNGLICPGTHNVLGLDPILGPLKNNGGPMRTAGLASISPALDVADGASSPGTDQRGIARPQGAGYDIGAFEGALPPNHPPVLANAIPDQNAAYNSPFSFTFAADTFSDPDAADTLTYSATDIPAGLAFDPATRTFSGTFGTAGTNTITITATDDGAPPFSTNVSFRIIAPKLALTAKADDVSRVIGQYNPYFTITYYGLAPGDAPWMIDNPPMAATLADPSSPTGIYPIVLSGGSDDVYDFVGLTNGTITVTRWPLRAQAANATRGVGQANPELVGILTGVLSGDNITATYTTTATPSSPAGDYPITPILNDPLGRLANYDVTLVSGLLSIEPDASRPDFQVLHRFGFTNRIGGTAGELIEGADGWLYGTGAGQNGMGVFRIQKDGAGFLVVRTFSGAEGPPAGSLIWTNNLLFGVSSSTVWSMNPDGTGFAALHTFDPTTNDGVGARVGLLAASDGMLYGTTFGGGTDGAGTVFRLNKDGSGYEVIHSFPASFAEGHFPSALIEGTNGLLYGTAQGGGPGGYYGDGTLFSLNKDGSQFNVNHFFTYAAADGAQPMSKLLQGSDGKLYGTTESAGAHFSGTAFSLDPADNSYVILRNFSDTDGANPDAPLIEGANGMLFGVTVNYGPASYGGTVFRMDKDGGGFSIIKQFGPVPDLYSPRYGLLLASDGALYGATSRGGPSDLLFGGGVFRLSQDGSGYSFLYPFSASGEDGRRSFAAVREAGDGMIYGTTTKGGSMDRGSVFRMNKDGSGYAVLHSFGLSVNDGQEPVAEVIEGSDGLIYGTTSGGGTAQGGTVFSMNKDGTGFWTMHNFANYPTDGSGPAGGLVEGGDGQLYGTTMTGGSMLGGTLFVLQKDGSGFSLLHEFNAAYPSGTLVQDTNGILYGTTSGGGVNGVGTIFRWNTNGTGFSVISDAPFAPSAGLLLASDGALYGSGSGSGQAPGGVFRVQCDGSGYQVLHAFSADGIDGYSPFAALSEGADGRIYGTTQFGGVSQNGTIFRLKKDGSGYSVFYPFPATVDFFDNKAALFRGTDGSLYATVGSDLDFGFVYRLQFAFDQPPILANPIPGQTNSYGSALAYTFPANTFTDPGQTLSYDVSVLPPGISFEGSTRTFSGTPTDAGTYAVTISATDSGTPPLSTNTTFQLMVAKAGLIVGADNKTRPYGQANPPLTGALIGVTNADNITALFITTATSSSLPGDYSITPILNDPDDRLGNYLVTTNLGILTVVCASNLTVTTTADSGPGSLRQAIMDANSAPCMNDLVISFNIPGVGVQTIAPLDGLPTITRPVIIDGYTQPGASPNTLANADNAMLLIELSGANLGAPAYGLRIAANGCTVRGLVINRFPDSAGVLAEAFQDNVVEGNFIGTDATGTNALPNSTAILNLGAGFRIGGNFPASRNVIAGNNYVGLSLAGCVSNQVLGNFIGVGADGLTVLPNRGWGIYLQICSQTQIGGPAPGARNVIAGNPNGCWINGGASNVIQGNYIGTDASGTLRRANVNGVVLDGSPNNLIGGTGAGMGNVLSGNGSAVLIEAGSSHNVLTGNLIGSDCTGTNALGNTYDGIYIGSAAGNVVGGTMPGAGNLISGNGAAGLLVYGSDATNNAVLGNSIFGNGGLGIDLYPGIGGVTPNDSGDEDEGPNHLQNFPEISQAVVGGGLMQMRYRVDSTSAAAAYPLTVEFFIAHANGGARALIHRDSYGTPQGVTNITFAPLVMPTLTNLVLATATDANGNTSEFSTPVAVTVPGDVTLSIASPGNTQVITWPSTALGFVLESTESLDQPIQWQVVTNGIADNGTEKSYAVTNDVGVVSRFYRLRQ